MNDRKSRKKIIEDLIQTERVYSFERIFEQVECSVATVRRDIKAIGGITSFTHCGRFVTLSTIPCFDENGIWFYRKVGFSKFNSSLELILNVIHNSDTGVSKESLDEILKIDVYKQIHVLLNRGRINRVKIGKRYHYISEALAKNKKRRLRLLNANNVEEHYSAKVNSADLVALLKAVLTEKKIRIDAKNIKRIAQKYSLRIPAKKIEQLLLKYDLPEKKTPPI